MDHKKIKKIFLLTFYKRKIVCNQTKNLHTIQNEKYKMLVQLYLELHISLSAQLNKVKKGTRKRL